MMSAAIRVLARAAAIQLEEMAAANPTAAAQLFRKEPLDKGKRRADPIHSDLHTTYTELDGQRLEVDRKGEEIIHEQQELLERDQLRIPESGPSGISTSQPLYHSPPTRPLVDPRRVQPPRFRSHNAEEGGLAKTFAALVDEKPHSHVDTTMESAVGRSDFQHVISKPVGTSSSPPRPDARSPNISPPRESNKVPDGISRQFGALMEEKSAQSVETPLKSSQPVGNDHQDTAVFGPADSNVMPQSMAESPSTSHTTTSGVTSTKDSTLDTPHVMNQKSEKIGPEPTVIDPPTSEIEDVEEEATPVLRASTVPSSRIGRLFHYGSLAASLSWGAASESIKRGTGGGSSGSLLMSDANIRRLVASLSRMRGAALKLGQFMSIQDNHMLPPELERVLQQVQAHANYMPDWQMEKVISTELGSTWADLFSNFERTPIASASIGQVHRATLADGGIPVAVKIQFPGIADSISSDLSYLTPLLRSSSVLPKGMFLQNTVAVMRRELADECDYVREGAAAERFREVLKDDPFFEVPRVIQEATTGRVLTMEWAAGKPLGKVKGLSQAVKDKIGTNILRLCLIELFQFRFMQTDPNLANFLYDASRDRMTLIDFGASREYSKDFMDGWYRLLTAAIRGDRSEMKSASQEIGYLTGEENDEMVNAHIDSMALVASPFAHSGPYDFSNQTITDSVRQLIPIMLKYRLTPPPQETYSLNRKLSGAFLVCAKLGARVDCNKLWEECVSGYQVGPESRAADEVPLERVAATA